MPKTQLPRVERLSGAFEQGKVYVSIDKSSNYESQLLLCKDLANRYSEFSSIVICLYANNSIGKILLKALMTRCCSTKTILVSYVHITLLRVNILTITQVVILAIIKQIKSEV